MLSFAVYIHDLDPFLIQFPEGWPLGGIRWYGLSYLVGFFIAFLLLKRITRVGVSTLKPQLVSEFVVTMAIGIVIGGRLGYCVFYRPELLISFTGSMPWWGVLSVSEGGMASHGGILGAIATSWWYAWRHQHAWGHLMDLSAFGAPLGLLFGRIANFINGELVGRPCSESFPLAVKFPTDLYDLPEMKDAALVRIAQALPPEISLNGLTRNEVIAVIIDQVRAGNQTITEQVAPLLVARHPSQLYAAFSEGFVVMVALLVWWRLPRKPWTTASLFVMVYAVMRIANEFFRMPDAHLVNSEFALIGATRGQLLSLAILALGLTIFIWAQRRKVEPLGGWMRREVTPDQ